MGDMADYYIEQVMDAEDRRLMYRSGELTDAEAYEEGIIDEMGYETHPSWRKKPQVFTGDLYKQALDAMFNRAANSLTEALQKQQTYIDEHKRAEKAVRRTKLLALLG